MAAIQVAADYWATKHDVPAGYRQKVNGRLSTSAVLRIGISCI
jgi:hypothetical protein